MNRLRLMFSLLILLTASTAFAQYSGGPRNQDVNDPCPTYDSCTMSGGDTYNPPTMITCSALKGRDQKCRSCTPIYTANGALYAYQCGGVEESASCECTPQYRGKYCNLKGSCTYEDDRWF